VLRRSSDIVALWEAGSAATESTDQYSDIDLQVVCSCETNHAFALIESAIPPIEHRYVEPTGSDLTHRIYFHTGSPKHFSADIGVMSVSSSQALSERMLIERHGNPVVLLDRKALIKPQHVNKVVWHARLENRIKELEASHPVYLMQVLKPLDRHHYTEAFAFYYHGLLRKLVELMGIRFRPYRYDFELRYLERDFPKKEQDAIHAYMQYSSPDDLRKKVALVDQDFNEHLAFIKTQGIHLP